MLPAIIGPANIQDAFLYIPYRLCIRALISALRASAFRGGCAPKLPPASGCARQSGRLPDGAICRFCVASFRPRGLQPNTDTLTVHREHPGGRSFFTHFQQRKATPFPWPAADRSRSSARTWIGEGLPISCRGW